MKHNTQSEKQTRKLRKNALRQLVTVDCKDYSAQARLWDCVFTNSTLGQLNTLRATLIRVEDRYFNVQA